MLRPVRGHIDAQEAAYIDLLIIDADPENRKRGLQKLCAHYRNGYRLRNPNRVVPFLVGLLHDEMGKVRRWALNALALVGGKTQVPAILEAIQRDRTDPDILGAGIAALSALVDQEQARTELSRADLPLEGAILLAAAQQSDGFKRDLRKTRVNIETAEPPELRLATILVGLSKAPDNLFSSRLPNEKVIGQLNLHPDSIVAQYSVWATWENPRLGVRHLGLPLKDTEIQLPNVRKYIYRLVTADSPTAKENLDLLHAAVADPSVEAREGLAAGIREIFFESIERLVLDWFADEESDPVRQRLLEHMAVNAARYGGYRVPVLQLYETAKPRGLVRARIEAAARGTDLYLELRKIALRPENAELFGDREEQPRPIAPPIAVPGPQAQAPPTIRSDVTAEWISVDEVRIRSDAAKVLVITALPKEAAAVKAMMDQRWKIGSADDPYIYELGIIRGRDGVERDVLLATCGMGTLSACALAANALRTFPNVEHVLMVGIAGGCPNPEKPDEHVRLGDIVISGEGGIVQYDFVKVTRRRVEIRAQPQKPSAKLLGVVRDLQADAMLSEPPWEERADIALQRLGSKFSRPQASVDVLHNGSSVVEHPDDPGRRPGSPRIHLGVIGTADALQKNPRARDKLRDEQHVRAIEMEGSGIQQAAWAQGKGILIIRGICDYCDEYKNDTWQNYAALIASAFARTLIETMPSEWTRSTPDRAHP